MNNEIQVREAGLIKQFKLIYVLIALVLLLGIIVPIWLKVPEYPFLWDNIFFIVSFVVLFYWLFFLKYTSFSHNKWVKLTIMFCALPFIILLLDRFTDFQAFLDEAGIQSMLDHLHHRDSQFMGRFIRNQMLFFGIGSIISTVLIAFRMIISIWRVKNKGTV